MFEIGRRNGGLRERPFLVGVEALNDCGPALFELDGWFFGCA